MFIVFEGGDGSGKSTQVDWLVASLAQAGVPHLKTFEPGATWLGEQMRRLLLGLDSGDIGPQAEALLYAADKAQHVHEVIKPALSAGKVVVCDRFTDSLIAYQGSGRGLAKSDVEWLATWATGELVPDLTVLLDMDPKTAISAIESKDRLESAGIEMHQRTREAFLQLAKANPDRYLVLPGLQGRAETAALIRTRIEQLGLVLPAPTKLLGQDR